MATNKYFRNYSYGREQRVEDDLMVEVIKIYGVDVQYMPRTIFNEIEEFGEDPLSKFDLAVPIEVYVNNLENFQGEGDFLSKFNLEIRDQITLTMARRRWDQIRTEKLIDEVGNIYLTEDNPAIYSSNTDNYLLESGSANGYSISSSRPLEGDLIYIPFINNGNGAIYEVKFVEHERVFYQHGKLYTYEMTCELFRYSSERFDTGNNDIDIIESRLKRDILDYSYLMENSDVMLFEDGGYIVQEFRLESVTSSANNELFTQRSFIDVDFSERNPFSEVDRY
jgi:hypothetical protein